MNDACTYLIEIRGQVDPSGLNAMSPLTMTETCTTPRATLVNIQADQSGLLGLLSYLNGLGLVIIAVQRQSDVDEDESQSIS